ncbi:MAG TPA: pitrilysin family protein [Gemmatimonadaceae bacterium]|nr:pitrilysin family protein [Gemmatimonadaceae bacterium]
MDLTKPPVLGDPKALMLPAVVTRELPNGLRLMIVEQHELPLADLVLVVKSGAETDETGKLGTATLATSLLKEGTASRNSLQIADQEAFLGVDVSAGTGWDATTISLHTPTAQMDSALALFADIALHPAFPANELDRLREQRLTSLLQVKDRGPEIANRAYAAIVYGSAAYGRPLSGDEPSTRAIQQADVRKFYDTYLRPNNATLLVVGDVKPDDIERRVRTMFGGWQRQAVPAASYGQPNAAKATTIYLVDKPGAAQSSFRIGGVGVARSTTDFFPLTVMNTALGGSFTSRLMQNLRETKAYTYGASSGFAMRRTPGPFIASAEVVAAKTDSALIEFMKELRAIRDTIPKDELEKTKRYLQLQLPGQFETTGGIAGNLSQLVSYDVPLNFFNSYTQGVAAVTQADAQRVARQYLDPDKLAIVIVGDRKSIEPTLRATKIGEVVVVDMAGRPAM